MMQLPLIGAVFCAVIVNLVIGDDQIYRLPGNVHPKHYDLHLKTDSHEGNASFRGSVKINFDVLEATSEIILHCARLNVSNVSLSGSDGRLIDNFVLELDDQKQFLVLRRTSVFQNGSYILEIKFQGSFTESGSEDVLYGLYSGVVEGNPRYFTVSRFEPDHARTVFPCFDEPFYKATFSLKITHHKSQTADSNMPLERVPEASEDGPDYVVSTFQRTPEISTHLLAFIISDFVPSGTSNHTMKTVPSAINETSYALQLAKTVLNTLDEHTALPYSSFMPKLTHMLVPGWWNPEQNWGLTVYSDRNVLFADERDSDAKAQRIAMAQIAHQVAQMWFGNLVTPHWWDSLWLREGFAMLYSSYAWHLADPSVRWMEWFRVMITAETMRGSPREAITFPCRTKGDLSMIITNQKAYTRAAAVLDMIRQIVGDEKWQIIVRSFLRRQLLGTVDSDDFYSEIQEVTQGMNLYPANRTVRQTFESWILNEGSPMLVIERLYNESRIKISQYKMKPVLEVGNESWIIPYDYACESSENNDRIGPIQWLTESNTLINTSAAADEWVVFNKLQFGFYRINYDTRNWGLIARALRANTSCIHRMNRAQLLDDAMYFFEFEHLNKNTLFEMITFLGNETESLVWFAALPILRSMEWEIGGVEYQRYFKVFVRHLTERYYDVISATPTTSTHERTMRRLMTYQICRAGNEKCLREARQAFVKAFQANSTLMPADEAAIVFCFGLRGASDEEFRWLMGQFESPGNQKRLIESLACVNRSDHLREVIERVHELVEDAPLHDQRYFLPRFVYGLRSDMGEDLFWRLSEVLGNDETLVDTINLTLLETLMNVMNSKVHSPGAAGVALKLSNEVEAKFSHLSLHFKWEYRNELDTPEFGMNGLVEKFVRSARLV